MSQDGGIRNLGGSRGASTIGLDASKETSNVGKELGLQPGKKVDASQSPSTTKIDGATTKTASDLKSTADTSTKKTVSKEKQERANAKDNSKAADEFKPGSKKDGANFKDVPGKDNLITKEMKKSFEKEFNTAVRNHPEFKTGKMSSDTLKGLAETACKTVVKKECDSLKDGFKTTGKAFSKLDGAKELTPTQKTEVDKFIEKKYGEATGSADGTMNPGKVKEIAKEAIEYADGLSKTNLSKEIDAIISKSPTLKEGVTKLNAEGWSIRFTGDKDGTGCYCDRTKSAIVVDINEKDDIIECVVTMAHEVGHALYTPDAKPKMDDPGMTKEKFVEAGLKRDFRDEGAAVLHNCKVREELAGLGKSKREHIHVAGETGDNFTKIYQNVKKGKITEDEGRNQIASAFGTLIPSGETVTYKEYYGSAYEKQWDKAHGIIT